MLDRQSCGLGPDRVRCRKLEVQADSPEQKASLRVASQAPGPPHTCSEKPLVYLDTQWPSPLLALMPQGDKCLVPSKALEELTSHEQGLGIICKFQLTMLSLENQNLPESCA